MPWLHWRAIHMLRHACGYKLANDNGPIAYLGTALRTRSPGSINGERKMKSPTNYINSNRRIVEKAKRDAFNQLLAKLDPEYVAKLRYDCLRMANTRLGPGSNPHAVVREAEQALEAQVRFLTEKAEERGQ